MVNYKFIESFFSIPLVPKLKIENYSDIINAAKLFHFTADLKVKIFS